MSGDTNSQENIYSVAVRAIALAQVYSHNEVTLEHILAALLEREDVIKCLKDLGIDTDEIQKELAVFIEDIQKTTNLLSPPIKSREFHEVFGRAIAFSKFSSRPSPNGVDVLLQLLQVTTQNSVITMLTKMGLDTKKIRNYILKDSKRSEDYTDTEPNDKPEAISYVKKYCINLNELAKLGKIDNVVGRLSETERIAQIICRRTKNNVVLVGAPGVGKTAIVEGLASNIVQKKVPEILQKSVIWSLDVGALVAGTRFRGDFEERMKFLLKAFSLLDESILFIDEIHMIMDAGSGNKGSLDVGNLLKPALARGSLRCIGSTTEKDWRQYFEKDRALVRRFKKLYIDEPSVEDAKLILLGVRSSYEIFHHVRYTDEALEAAVDLTNRYVHDGKLPDKAIDVIDEAGSRRRISGSEDQIINVSDIEEEVAKITKMPTRSIQEDESGPLEKLDKDLKAVIFGQNKAIEVLVNSVMVGRAGLRNPDKPQGSFLFTGPTGCGKSETARQLAKTLGIPLIKFDMSEYMEKHSISKLIGSPPGYIGFGDGAAGNGLLINAIDRSPSCVLLFDEVEKAHADVLNIFLQIMEDGVLTNSEGKVVSFRNAIIIMTSNVGVAQTEQQIGFVQSEIDIDHGLVNKVFLPEFRNRLDSIISFNALDKVSVSNIVDKFLSILCAAVRDRNITIEITDVAKRWLVERGYNSIYGARPLDRLITEKIRQPLSKQMLFGDLKNGGTVRIAVEAGELVLHSRT